MEDAISLMRGTQEFQKNLATTKSNDLTVYVITPLSLTSLIFVGSHKNGIK